jgi:exosortase/archaeosortase family protein
MKLKPIKQSYKASLKFLLKTLLFYAALHSFFVVYTGVTIEGGKFYIPFLAEHVNLIGWFRTFLLWGGAQFTMLMGYSSFYSEYHLVVENGTSIHLVHSCLGLDLISAYLALVLAWPAQIAYKVVSSLLGVILIIVLNIIRLGGLGILFTRRSVGFFESVNHHDLFNIVVLLMVLAMFAVHVKYSGQNEVKKIGG